MGSDSWHGISPGNMPDWHLPHTLTAGDVGAVLVIFMLVASSLVYAYQFCRAVVPKRKAD
jgi:hypothetical protein